MKQLVIGLCTASAPRASLVLLLGVLALCFAPTAEAQRRRAKDLPANDPSLCPYTGGDPDLLAAAGLVSLGGFEFATTDTKAIDAAFPLLDIRWVETAHFQIGFAGGECTVRNDERAKIEGELAELRLIWPDLQKRPRTLDPWLRTYLFAHRLEKQYQRMLEVLAVTPDVFPDGSRPWDMTGSYMGEGPYLGQKGKYELLVLPTASSNKAFLSAHFGLQTQLTQRWNVKERDTLILTVPVDQGVLSRDTALHCHVVFNMTTNLLDGYKHYSYELPVWLREGLAHVMEREIDPRYNSFTFSEGAGGERVTKSDWLAEVRKLVRTDSAPRMAELINISAYGDLLARHHLTVWSMTDYLLREHPAAYAKLLDVLKGRTNAQGMTDASNLRDVHRDAFRDILGMSYAAFDVAWGTWVQSPAAEGRGAGTGGDDPAPSGGPGTGPGGLGGDSAGRTP